MSNWKGNESEERSRLWRCQTFNKTMIRMFIFLQNFLVIIPEYIKFHLYSLRHKTRTLASSITLQVICLPYDILWEYGHVFVLPFKASHLLHQYLKQNDKVMIANIVTIWIFVIIIKATTIILTRIITLRVFMISVICLIEVKLVSVAANLWWYTASRLSND